MDEAKEHLAIDLDDSDFDVEIRRLMDIALGSIEGQLQRDIYLTQDEVPLLDKNAIIFLSLKRSRQESLKGAIKMRIASLFKNKESTVDDDLFDNPEFEACLSMFSGVFIG